MKRKIKVSVSRQGVLPTASWANLRPTFGAELEFEQEFQSEDEVLLTIQGVQDRLNEVCTQAFESEAEKARIQKVKQDLKNFRFYTIPGTDEELPSVSSINGFDKEWFRVTDQDLKVLSAQGNLIDAEWKNLIRTGKYSPNSELKECTVDRFVLKMCSKSDGKKLQMDGWDIEAFLAKFPLQKMKVGEVVYNLQYRYAGTPDILCEYNGVPTLCDVKRTKSETENFIQMAAYAKCKGLENIKQLMIINMKPAEDGGTKQGYSKPTLTTEIDKYFELFLDKRAQVKKIFGV